jgi:2-keto-3-deoxy-L-rhamnonate aldolase RhmA
MSSVRERLRRGAPPLAGFLNLIPSPVATQALAAAGADVVAIDQEHGPIGPESLHAMVASTAGTPAPRGFGYRGATRPPSRRRWTRAPRASCFR